MSASRPSEPASSTIDQSSFIEFANGLFSASRGNELLIKEIKTAAKTVADVTKDAAQTIADGTKDAAQTIADGTKDAAQTISDGTKDAAKDEPTPMKMFAADQIITGILACLSALGVGLLIALYTSGVTCSIPDGSDGYYLSDPITAYINTYCADKHAFGGEFTFYIYVETIVLSLPLLIFYQIWGGPDLNRHVGQILSTVESLTQQTNDSILEDALNVMENDFERSQARYERAVGTRKSIFYRQSTSKSDPSHSAATDPADPKNGDLDPSVNDQLRLIFETKGSDELDLFLLQDSPQDVFDRAVAVVGLGRYEQSWEKRNQWTIAYYSMIIFQLINTVIWILIWSCVLHYSNYFQFALNGSVSTNSFECTQIPTPSVNPTISMTINCIYPPRKLFYVVWVINMVLLPIIFAISIIRLPWRYFITHWPLNAILMKCCRRRFWFRYIPYDPVKFPDDIAILFEACVSTSPDTMRIKSFAVYKKEMEKAKRKIEIERKKRVTEKRQSQSKTPDHSTHRRSLLNMRLVVMIEKFFEKVHKMRSAEDLDTVTSNAQLHRYGSSSLGSVQVNSFVAPNAKSSTSDSDSNVLSAANPHPTASPQASVRREGNKLSQSALSIPGLGQLDALNFTPNKEDAKRVLNSLWSLNPANFTDQDWTIMRLDWLKQPDCAIPLSLLTDEGEPKSSPLRKAELQTQYHQLRLEATKQLEKDIEAWKEERQTFAQSSDEHQRLDLEDQLLCLVQQEKEQLTKFRCAFAQALSEPYRDKVGKLMAEIDGLRQRISLQQNYSKQHK